MRSHRLARGLGITAGGAAIVAMVGFTGACGNNEQKAPGTSSVAPSTTETTETTETTATTTAPSSSAPAMTPAPAVTPTEKDLDSNGGSLFTPSIHATQRYTPSPGHH